MEKPAWHLRSSSIVVDSPYLRLRKDEIELPDGAIIPEYFVRESRGFSIVFAVTNDERVVLVRQYRYPCDRLLLEFPAGSIDPDETPEACARRELLEETGYSCERLDPFPPLFSETVRSDARMFGFLALGARPTHAQRLDAGEVLEVETVALADLPALLRDGSIEAASCVALGYLGLERLGYVAGDAGRSSGRSARIEPNG
jgi:8-oxo-dGTP pyrophosphatase MutT (NUDIX family)